MILYFIPWIVPIITIQFFKCLVVCNVWREALKNPNSLYINFLCLKFIGRSLKIAPSLRNTWSRNKLTQTIFFARFFHMLTSFVDLHKFAIIGIHPPRPKNLFNVQTMMFKQHFSNKCIKIQTNDYWWPFLEYFVLQISMCKFVSEQMQKNNANKHLLCSMTQLIQIHSRETVG